MPNLTRRFILAAAPALACAPAMVNAAQDDPLVALAAEYHRTHEALDGQGLPDEVADQYSDYSHALTLEMLELTPTTVAGAAALLGVVHYEISEGLLWDEHPRMIETAMRYLEAA